MSLENLFTIYPEPYWDFYYRARNYAQFLLYPNLFGYGYWNFLTKLEIDYGNISLITKIYLKKLILGIT